MKYKLKKKIVVFLKLRGCNIEVDEKALFSQRSKYMQAHYKKDTLFLGLLLLALLRILEAPLSF